VRAGTVLVLREAGAQPEAVKAAAYGSPGVRGERIGEPRIPQKRRVGQRLHECQQSDRTGDVQVFSRPATREAPGDQPRAHLRWKVKSYL
jgi:hypothetical protein